MPEIGPQPAATMPVIDELPEPEPEPDEVEERRPTPPEFGGLAETMQPPAMVAEAVIRPEADVAEQDRLEQDGHRSAHGDVAPEDEADVLQQGAIISEPAEPRRGWWNRFVRKSD